MKRFWRGFKRNKIYKLLAVALVIRLALVPLAYHSDVNNHVIWGIYAQEFGLRGFYDWINFGNYARPDYPPLAMILFLLMRWIWSGIFLVLWKINISIGIFPSGIMAWFDRAGYFALLKLPAILADMGIGYLIYCWVRKAGRNKEALVAAGFYLFNPGIIYISAWWGQIDAVVGFFGLLALILVIKKEYLKGAFSFVTATMIKQTLIPIFPFLVLQSIKQRIKVKTILLMGLLVMVYAYLVGALFIDSLPIRWLVRTYLSKFLGGPATLYYINLNAFNAWGLVLGLERISESTQFWGVSLAKWGWIIGAVFVIFIIWRAWKGAEMFFSCLMVYFSIFMFFPRIHERYLYPVFIFFPLVIAKWPKLKKVFYILSAVFMVNLYHWWWVPEVGFLVSFFDFEIVERGLCLVNLILFGYLTREYYKIKLKWS
jgi:dolichyl-phosphate-mannose-protein mannosyltransferase